MAQRMSPPEPILLVDDEKPWLQSLSMALKISGEFNQIETCSDSREVLPLLRSRRFSALLLDLVMPHLSGDELLPQIVEEFPETPVLILSGMNQVETAVDCMKKGAFDYFIKTGEEQRLIAGIHRALSFRSLKNENHDLKKCVLDAQPQDPAAFSPIITQNPQMRAIFRYIEMTAQSPEPFLITGESGVGKELIARAIHRCARPEAPWVPINIAGLDETVFSDTLFGHARGAFTGAVQSKPGLVEEADGGTLFLDEIGDLSPASQVKLLRLLQEGEFFRLGSNQLMHANVRIICATNQDLSAKLAEGSFRKDLYYRIQSHSIRIPSLRERPEDLPLLFRHFLREAASTMNKSVPCDAENLCAQLQGHDFPGNIRELRAMAFDAVSTHNAGALTLIGTLQPFIPPLSHVPEVQQPLGSSLSTTKNIVYPDPLPTIQEATAQLVQEALKRSDGNQTVAARALGITQSGLSKRLKRSK